MTNETAVSYQSAIVDSFSSEFFIIDSVFVNLTLYGASFKITESNVTIENSRVTQVSLGSDDLYEFMSATTQSDISVSGLNFTDWSVPLVYWLQSVMKMDSLLLENVAAKDHIITIDQGTLIFTNSVIKNISSSDQETVILYVDEHATHNHGDGEESKEIEQMNLHFSNISQTVIEVNGATLHESKEVTFSYWYRALIVAHEGTANFENSVFEYLGNSNVSSGGAIYVEFGNIGLTGVTFRHNKAQNGGAIDLDCEIEEDACSYKLVDCTFINNTATYSGGAIRFNAYRPTITNALYENNTALYGPNISSYAVKIKLVNSSSDEIVLDNLGSGVQITNQIYLVLVDHFENQMVLDNTSQISIKISSSHQSIIGTNTRKVTNGVAAFDDLMFIAHPGEKQSEFSVTSTAINSEIVNANYLNSCTEAHCVYSQNPLLINFRYCQPGEIIQNKV